MGTGSLRSHPSPAASDGAFSRGDRVIYLGSAYVLASNWLEYAMPYTVSWCGEYLDQMSLRLFEVQGFTFNRALFEKAA